MRRPFLTLLALLHVASVLTPAVSAAGESTAPLVPPDHDIRRVVVVHFDTTRVDDIGCYGGIPKTPAFDALAKRGMRYTNSIAPIPKTSPSAASFLTGRLASGNGVYECGHRLREELRTLAEVLRDEGYRTAGFVSNANLFPLRKGQQGKVTGFDQGFDVYECIWFPRPEVPAGPERNRLRTGRAGLLTKAALRFINDHPEDKFFLWAFHIDPHAPYQPPPLYDAMYLEDEDLLAESIRVDALIRGRTEVFVPEWTHSHEYIARHMSEVTHTDYWLGEMVKALDALPGRTLYIVTADHGESFGERGGWFAHGGNIHTSNVDVPLVLVCDDVVPVGVSDALVANIDLPVTILHLLGIDFESQGLDGRSLLPTFDVEDPWPERTLPIQAKDGKIWRGARSGAFSLQLRRPQGPQERPLTLLYDRRADPQEEENVAEKHPAMTAELEAFVATWFSPTRETLEAEDLSDDPEMAERLRALGYL